MDDRMGAPPRSGWAGLVPELLVDDIAASLAFWCGLLGFVVAYQRSEQFFAYLERPEGAQIMLCQRRVGGKPRRSNGLMVAGPCSRSMSTLSSRCSRRSPRPAGPSMPARARAGAGSAAAGACGG